MKRVLEERRNSLRLRITDLEIAQLYPNISEAGVAMSLLSGSTRSYLPLRGGSDGTQHRRYRATNARFQRSGDSKLVLREKSSLPGRKLCTPSRRAVLRKVMCFANTKVGGSTRENSQEDIEMDDKSFSNLDWEEEEYPVAPSRSFEESHEENRTQQISMISPKDVKDISALVESGVYEDKELSDQVLPIFRSDDMLQFPFENSGRSLSMLESSVSPPARKQLINRDSINQRRLELERTRKCLEAKIVAIRASYSSTGTQATPASMSSIESAQRSLGSASSSYSDRFKALKTKVDDKSQPAEPSVEKAHNEDLKEHSHTITKSILASLPITNPVEKVHQDSAQENDCVWELEVSPQIPVFYSGAVSHGCVPHGHGSIEFANGDTYVGPFKHGQMHGTSGLYTWENRSVYKGEFSNNLQHGHGEYRMEGERRYVGNFEHGRLTGYGEAYSKDGSFYHKGQWERGGPVHKYIPFIQPSSDDVGGLSVGYAVSVACDVSLSTNEDPGVSIYDTSAAVGLGSRARHCLSKYSSSYVLDGSGIQSGCGENSCSTEASTVVSQECSHSETSTTASEDLRKCSEGSVFLNRSNSIQLAIKRLRKRVDMLEMEREVHMMQDRTNYDDRTNGDWGEI